MSTPVAHRIVSGLKAGGTRRLFGVPGGGPNLHQVGAASEKGIPFVLCHTETAACIAASTYGLLTETVGAVVVTRGPGVASAVNGMAQATLDKQPLVLVGDTVAAPDRSWVGHQEFNQPALMGPVTKWSGTVGYANTARASQAAVRLATAHPQGAVHLDMDSTVAGAMPPEPPTLPTGLTPPESVTHLVRTAEHPLLIVGTGALPWIKEVRRVVAGTGCPALTTYHAKGLIDETTPEFGGLFTSSLLEAPLLQRSDLVLAVGVDPVEPLPRPFLYDAPVIELNPWPQPRRFFPGQVEIQGPVGPILESVAAHLADNSWDEGVGQTMWRAARRSLWEDGPRIHPPPGRTGSWRVVCRTGWSNGHPGRRRPLSGCDAVAARHQAPPGPDFQRSVHHGICASRRDGGRYGQSAETGGLPHRRRRPGLCAGRVGDPGQDPSTGSGGGLQRCGAHPDRTKATPRPGRAGGRPLSDQRLCRHRPRQRMEGVVAENQSQLAAALDGPRPRLIDARIDPTAYRAVIETSRG